MNGLLCWKIMSTGTRVFRAIHCIAAGIMVAVATLLPQSAFAHPLSHHHNRPHPEAAKQVVYDFDHFSAAQRMAICTYWSRYEHKPISIPDWFITVAQSHRLAKAGFKVIRFHYGRGFGSDLTLSTNAYSPSYWLRWSPYALLVSAERLPLNQSIEGSWVKMFRMHERWQVTALKTAPVPIALEAVLCHDVIRRPYQARFLDIYIDHAKQIRPFIKESYVRIRSFEQKRDDRQALLEISVNNGSWIDSRTVLVDFWTTSKSEPDDETEQIVTTLLFRYEKGQWQSEDIGIAPGGE